MKKIFLILFIGIVLISCGGKNQSDSEASTQWDIDTNNLNPHDQIGDRLVIHDLSDSDRILPTISHGATAQYIENHIYESLIIMDNKSLKLVPQVALEMPDVSDDHLTLIFRLRQDVYFSDGTPLTGHDVIFSLKSLKNPLVTESASSRNYYQNVKKAELVDGDPYTVKFTCSDVFFKHLDIIGETKILPKHYYDPDSYMDEYSFEDLEQLLYEFTKSDNKDFSETGAYKYSQSIISQELGRNPMGSGPYVFKEWKTDDRFALQRDPDYWGNAGGRPNVGFLDQIVYKTVKEFDAALIGLKSGEIDLIRSMPQELYQHQTKSRKVTENYHKMLYDIPSYGYIGWNSKNPLFRSKMVRRAMTHLCDREKIIEILFYGEGQVAKSSVYFKRPEYNDDIVPYPFDPELARQILLDEGWKDLDGDGILDKEIDGNIVPFEFTFLTNNGNETRKQIGIIMAENLRKVGIKADVRQMEWAVYLSTVRDQNFDAIILGWVMSIRDTDPYQIFHSSQSIGKGSNYVSFMNDRADELIVLNRKEFDPEKRHQYMYEFQEILHEEQPYTFVYVAKSNIVYHKRFRGVNIYSHRPGYDPLEWWSPTVLHKYVDQP